MQLFYKPDISGSPVVLDETESRHCIKVLRLAVGDQVRFVDGKGGLYTAKITDANFRQCKLELTDKKEGFGKPKFHLHIAIAPTKNIERFEWFLEKATEIGVGEVTPLLTDFSERKVVHPERLEKITISAIKQSEKAYLPKLNPLTPFNNLIKLPAIGKAFIAHCHEGEKPHLKNMVNRDENILVLIGPEGDFSEKEVAAARAAGFAEISLGKSRLRTETAGVAACHIINLIND
jgi:16S rRNA (uracil1498-N3)-methyltransferase